MKNLFFVLLLAFSVSVTVAQTEKTQLQTTTKNVQGVEKTDKEINLAIEDKDSSVLKLLLSDDFSNVSSNGRLLNKKGYIADVKDMTIASLKTDDLEVRLYGDTAVAVGVLVVLYRNGNSDYYFYTRVYAWKNDKWQMVSAQYTIKNR